METTTVAFFSNTPPSQKLRTFRETSARIKALEAQLGIAASTPIFHMKMANARIAELEAVVASRTAAPKIAVTATAAQPAPGGISLAEWQEMSDGDQRAFARDGRMILRSAFLSMPSRAQTFFLSAGGHIAPDVTVPEPVAPTPAGCTSRADFFALSPKEQTQFFKNNGKLSPT